jgi:hypothetical protein
MMTGDGVRELLFDNGDAKRRGLGGVIEKD